jgi:hypothetical protein
MEVPDRALRITKSEGATRQVEAAIEALQRGDFDLAITLAGAAEGMLDRKGHHMLSYMLNSPRAAEFDRKELVATINQHRDWLKHVTPEQPDTLQIEREHAASMIARAASKLEQWPSCIEDFRKWLIHNHNELWK